jgi:5-methylcytosine-specific restriction endonuclease McrA
VSEKQRTNYLMATNTSKRIPVKWIRDGAKSAYEKKDVCHICGSQTDLELHHTNSLTLLLEKWAKEMGKDISTDESVLAVRDEFIDAHHSELYDMVFTLCNKHHQKLHSVFGKAPPLSTSDKQNRWIEKQKAKALGLVTDSAKGSFSAFY